MAASPTACVATRQSCSIQLADRGDVAFGVDGLQAAERAVLVPGLLVQIAHQAALEAAVDGELDAADAQPLVALVLLDAGRLRARDRCRRAPMRRPQQRVDTDRAAGRASASPAACGTRRSRCRDAEWSSGPLRSASCSRRRDLRAAAAACAAATAAIAPALLAVSTSSPFTRPSAYLVMRPPAGSGVASVMPHRGERR